MLSRYRLALIVAASATLAHADGFIITAPAGTRPDPRPTVRPPSYPLEVRHHTVSVSIAANLAQTAIDQTFHNPHAIELEGTYLFPVPRGATISQFSMEVSGVQTAGEVQEQGPARTTYESIVRRTLDPALLEYVGSRLVKMQIYPIAAHADKPVKITYSEVLDASGGLVVYRYPLNTEKFSSKPLERVEVSIAITESVPLGAIYSPTHPVEVVRDGPTRATVRYAAEQVTPERDLVVCFQRLDEGLGLSLLSHPGSGGGHFAALVSAPPSTLTKRAPADVVLAFDASSSMSEGGKLDQLQRAAAHALASLEEGDRFGLVDFSTLARSFSPELLAATAENKAAALRHIQGLTASGGTHLQDALENIAEMSRNGAPERALAAILVTDGAPTVGERDAAALAECLAPAGPRLRLFVLGVGSDHDTALLDALAERGRGFVRYAADHELEGAVRSLFDAVALPALSEVRLRSVSPDVAILDMQPSRPSELFEGTGLVLLGRYRGVGPAVLELTATHQGRPFSRRFEVVFDAQPRGHGLIAHLHAQRKVGALLARIRATGETEELVREIAYLARRHGILTPYTSYLVLEDERMWRERFTAPRGPQVHNPRSELGAPQPAVIRVFDAQFNASARDLARRALGAREGAPGVEAVRQIDALRDAQGAGRDDRDPGTLMRRVDDRAFYRDGERWIDATLSADAVSAARRVVFLSDEYFALLAEDASVGEVLSLGARVVFRTRDGAALEIAP